MYGDIHVSSERAAPATNRLTKTIVATADLRMVSPPVLETAMIRSTIRRVTRTVRAFAVCVTCVASWNGLWADGPDPGVVGVGDDRRGYERDDYRSQSAQIASAGRPLDLVALIAQPPLGLPAVPGAKPTKAMVDLGRRLFFDRRLSFNGTLSCGMCHVPEQGFTQNELATPVGFGGASVKRNAPA